MRTNRIPPEIMSFWGRKKELEGNLRRIWVKGKGKRTVGKESSWGAGKE